MRGEAMWNTLGATMSLTHRCSSHVCDSGNTLLHHSTRGWHQQCQHAADLSTAHGYVQHDVTQVCSETAQESSELEIYCGCKTMWSHQPLLSFAPREIECTKG